MKLLRYGPPGKERPGLLDADGVVRDLSRHIVDITPQQLAPESLKRIAGLDWQSLPEVAEPQRYGPPVHGTRKFLAIGLNYADHAAESNMPIPQEPILFTKATSCIQGPNDDIMLPRNSVKSDWEVELGVVIGSTARYVDEADAMNHVAGFLTVNDLSEREFQLERGSQWDKGKGCDTFGPIGPWLVTCDEVGDPQNLDLWLDVNGKRMQRGNTRTMVFPVANLVSYVSCFLTLEPGDIITTGTPPGVGLGMKPPVFLKAGDTIELGIEKLGVQRQKVTPWRRLE
ncbi:MAG: fumarylacetoacetate hydrolase family protein [Gammaproteobacteria bacterium]|nr:fumarylacetoacetate hydrolase family protein [Gammaproteobacteria bacterium]MDH5305163.1 fumarylacetoacetate hydrolase family protein [Gammaproteobacteria bacterium]MDH5321696.1 fumarylacetoacetate hydrolase family protein [Gammaproteobacteria bacterium]